jgi:hypothetical protein
MASCPCTACAISARIAAFVAPIARHCDSLHVLPLAATAARYDDCRIANEMESAPMEAAAPLPFRSLLYRYLFFAWLFRDAGVRDLLERAAALRHNRAMARWLPTYMRRWAVIGVAGWAIGSAVEWALGAPLSLLFFLPSVISVPINSVILVAWIGLKLSVF